MWTTEHGLSVSWATFEGMTSESAGQSRPEPKLRGGAHTVTVKPLALTVAGQPKTVVRLTIQTQSMLDPSHGQGSPGTYSFGITPELADDLVAGLNGVLHFIDRDRYPSRRVVEKVFGRTLDVVDEQGGRRMVSLQLGHVPEGSANQEIDAPLQDFMFQPGGARMAATLLLDLSDDVDPRQTVPTNGIRAEPIDDFRVTPYGDDRPAVPQMYVHLTADSRQPDDSTIPRHFVLTAAMASELADQLKSTAEVAETFCQLAAERAALSDGQ